MLRRSVGVYRFVKSGCGAWIALTILGDERHQTEGKGKFLEMTGGKVKNFGLR